MMKTRKRMMFFAAMGMLLALSSTRSYAQNTDADSSEENGSGSSSLNLQDESGLSSLLNLPEIFKLLAKSPLQITPKVISVDAKTQTAIMNVENTSDNVVTVSFKAKPPESGSSLDTTWIKELPPALKLKEHETQKVTLHLAIPASLKAGEYAANVVATVDEFKTGGQTNSQTIRPPDGGGPKRTIKLVYQAK